MSVREASGVLTAGMHPKDFMGTREIRQVQAEACRADKPIRRGRFDGLAEVSLRESPVIRRVRAGPDRSAQYSSYPRDRSIPHNFLAHHFDANTQNHFSRSTTFTFVKPAATSLSCIPSFGCPE